LDDPRTADEEEEEVRRRKNEEQWHKFTATEDFREGTGNLTFVGGGRFAYLSIHTDRANGRHHAAFSGPANLRALARAILREVPEPKMRPRRGK
jgi:hypothetical protein